MGVIDGASLNNTVEVVVGESRDLERVSDGFRMVPAVQLTLSSQPHGNMSTVVMVTLEEFERAELEVIRQRIVLGL